MLGTIKGIIFDMDNTLLRSNIDFEAMKLETFQFLVSLGLVSADLNLDHHTTATIIEKGLKSGLMTPELLEKMWEIPKKYEVAGMINADLEPGVTSLLNELRNQYLMTVVTNNSIDAAEKALSDNLVLDYFDCVVGREMMKSIKPAPDGFLYILSQYKEIPAEEWISVGDSWIDGKASTEAGIRFVAYQSDEEMMQRMGVRPIAEISDIREMLLLLDNH